MSTNVDTLLREEMDLELTLSAINDEDDAVVEYMMDKEKVKPSSIFDEPI